MPNDPDRYELNAILKTIAGNNNVYYQPPESLKMSYPCIVYTKSDITDRYASNGKYIIRHCYEITVIDKNPDSEIVARMEKYKEARFNRHFTSDGLNHDVFTLYFK